MNNALLADFDTVQITETKKENLYQMCLKKITPNYRIAVYRKATTIIFNDVHYYDAIVQSDTYHCFCVVYFLINAGAVMTDVSMYAFHDSGLYDKAHAEQFLETKRAIGSFDKLNAKVYQHPNTILLTVFHVAIDVIDGVNIGTFSRLSYPFASLEFWARRNEILKPDIICKRKLSSTQLTFRQLQKCRKIP